MSTDERLDRTDARLLLELQHHPRATVMTLATTLRLSRNTVHARLARLERAGVLNPLRPGVEPGMLGYPLTAFVKIEVVQQMLRKVGEALAEMPEVVEVAGVSGSTDLIVRIVAVDADDMYRIAGMILAKPGIVRTETSLVMRRIVDYRLEPLLTQMVDGRADPDPS